MDKVVQEYGSFLVGKREKAKYTESEDEMFRHNPYVEALPELKVEELQNKIARCPSYSDELRLHAAYKRLDYVLRISLWVQPMPAHIIVAQRIMRFIKQGYMPKNPLTAEWVRQIHCGFPGTNVNEEDIGCFLRPNASGMAFIGPSGIGKSLTVETVLSLIPQIIYHNQYHGKAFDRTQILWLKVDAAKDGSAKGLCRTIFSALDRNLGTNYYKQYFNYSAKDSLEVLLKLAWVFGLGLLVIDEVQRLNLASSGGEKELINFFTTLQKSLNIPVVLIGTYSAMNLFKDDFSCSRPLCAQGDLIWDRYSKNDEAWTYFIDALWKYQFTNTETSLTKSLRSTIYEESQGITDIAVKLYMLAQWEIIGASDEKITPKLIKVVADRHLNLVRPMLTALRTGDIERIRQIKDLYSPISDDIINQSFRRAQEKVMVLDTKASISGNDKNSQSSPVVDISTFLIEAGFDKDVAWAAANEATEHSPGKSSLAFLKQAAFRLALIRQNKDEFKDNEDKGLDGTAIRDCKGNGNEKDSPYEQLENKGLIMDLKQFYEHG